MGSNRPHKMFSSHKKSKNKTSSSPKSGNNNNNNNWDDLDVVKMFAEDPATEGIVLIGEIGGDAEEQAAAWIRDNYKKPVVGFIAGLTAPPGKRMGHAGAIVGGDDRTGAEKVEYLKSCGIKMVQSPSDIGDAMKSFFS